MSLGLGKWSNVFVKLGLGFFITCQISKSNTLSCGFISSSVHLLRQRILLKCKKKKQNLTVDDSWACAGTEVHVNVFITITCIIKTEFECQVHKCYLLQTKAGISVKLANLSKKTSGFLNDSDVNAASPLTYLGLHHTQYRTLMGSELVP